jgi:hypothetical protein
MPNASMLVPARTKHIIWIEVFKLGGFVCKPFYKSIVTLHDAYTRVQQAPNKNIESDATPHVSTHALPWLAYWMELAPHKSMLLIRSKENHKT